MSNSADDDDDVPTLSKEALDALSEYYREQEKKAADQNDVSGDYHAKFEENWQLSQFWYDDETVKILSDHVSSVVGDRSRIALISCPTLYEEVRRKCPDCEVKLFEYDRRFAKFGGDYRFYDYKCPLDFDAKFERYFDIVVADPPFLSEECLTKTAKSICFLAESKIILCTGAVMEELAEKLLRVKKIKFQPRHRNNLANEFATFVNYPTDF